MGRLFWKIFGGFWIALLAAAIGIGISVHLEQRARFDRWVQHYEQAPLATGPMARARIDEVGAMLQHGGPALTARVLASRDRRLDRRPVLVVDDQGRELLGRQVPSDALAHARRLADGTAIDNTVAAARISARDGQRFLVLSAPVVRRMPGAAGITRHRAGPATPASPWVLILAGLAASLAFSAVLAWYMASPIRLMRNTAQRIARGDLDARVSPGLGKRRDELTELGHDFDAMASHLQSLLDAQRRLLHDVSHELRSPLARLQAAIGLAEQTPERTPEMLARIERESQRLDALVGEVLELSRLQSNPGLDTPRPVDISELIGELVDDARFEATQADVSVRWQHDGGPVMILGQPQLLHRALENVVRNALRYSPPGGEILIEYHLERDMLAISIADRGPGVAADALDRIFDPFTRAQSEPDATGTGLGLAIAQRAVKAHGGSIHAQARSGGGLCIWIRLPLPPDTLN